MIFWTAATLKDIQNLAIAQKWLETEGKETSLLTHGLMHMLLEHVSSEQGWRITKKNSGQPIATSRTGTQPYSISLSHSNEWAVCAISKTGPVGIDIEFHKQRNFNKLAAFGFGKREQERIQTKGEDEFYKTWVLREAYAKMRSKSILSTLHGKSFITLSDTTGCWRDEKANFFYKKINKHYSLGIASKPTTLWDSSYLTEIGISDLLIDSEGPNS